MVVDHAGGLHQCVADCGADEAEAALGQVFAQRVGLFRLRGNFACPGVLDWLAVHEAPDVGVETAEFLLNFQE